MILDSLNYFLRDVLIGDPIIYGVLILLSVALILLISRTNFDQIITFLIIPTYGLMQTGYLAGAIASSLWALIVILAGLVFFKNIRNVMGG